MEDACRRAILFVDHASALGGAELALLTLLRHLDRSTLAPHLATPAGALAVAARRLDVTVHEVPLPRLRHEPAAPWRWARGVAALARIIRQARIAVVQHNTMRASIYATAAARLTRRPLVWQVHDIFPSGVYVRLMCAMADAAIAVSAAVAAPLPCAHKLWVIHNGVTCEDFQGDQAATAAQLRARWGVPPDATLMGQVARLQPWKGQRDVLAAAERLLRDGANVYVAIVGGDIFGDAPAYVDELRRAVAARGLAPRIVFTGHVEDVPAILSALDIVVHASDHEPFGRILIEAGAAARPVVAYESGAVGEIIEHERTGLLVRPGDRDALATALRRLIDDPPLAHRLGAAAREAACRRFDARRLTRDVESVLWRVMTHAPRV